MKLIRIVACILACLATPLGSHAQDVTTMRSSTAVDPEINTFIQSYVSAKNSRNREEYMKYMHPKSLEILGQNKEYSELCFQSAFLDAIPDQYKLKVKPINPEAVLPRSDLGYVYPIRPTAMAFIRYSLDPRHSSEWVAFLAKDGSKWYEVIPSSPPQK